MDKQNIEKADLDTAISRLKLMKFFPTDPAAHGSLADLLASMCPHAEALEWLISTLVNRVPEWPGAKEVRALLCTRYDPADGIDPGWCSLPGFSAADYEAQHYARHMQLTGKSPGYERALMGGAASAMRPDQLAAALAGTRDMGSYIADELADAAISKLALTKQLPAASGGSGIERRKPAGAELRSMARCQPKADS